MSLWLPPTAVAYRCSCGSEFSDKRKGQQHAMRCIRTRADEIAAEAEAREEPGIGSPLDPEAWKWARKRHAEGKVGFKRGRAA